MSVPSLGDISPLTRCLLVFITVLFIYQVISRMFRGFVKNLPPGPRGWRTNVEIIKATWRYTLHDLASDWAHKYGPITFVYSLGQPLALLNTPEMVRKLLGADEYKFLVADRLITVVTRQVWYNGKDLIFTKYDGVMRKKRRMFYNVIGLYGDGVTKFENVVWIEMERLFAELDQCQGQDVDLPASLSRSLKNIIYIMVAGKVPAHPNIVDILEEYDTAFNQMLDTNVESVISKIPILTKLPGKYKSLVDRMMTAKKAAEEEMYYKLKRTHIPGEPRGIADLLFDLQQKPGNEWMDKDQEHVLAFLTSFFVAAHLTSRASVLGIFLILLNYPQVAKDIQQEVDQVIGNDRPRLEFRSQMPKTEAVILESLRLISQVPINGYRIAAEDIHIDGMVIPKKTQIFINSWHFHHDERYFPDPWKFKPERFLDTEGNLLPNEHPNRKNLIPFGMGPRSCPGDGISRARVFLFMTCILQRFDLLPPAHHELVPADFKTNHENSKGFVRQSRPYKCRLVRRYQ